MADNCRFQFRFSFVAAIGTMLCLSLPAPAATNVTATANDVSDFLGGQTGKLVYVDQNDDGKVYWIDLADMSVHLLSDDTGCSEPLLSPDGTRVVYGIYNIVSKWPGESSNNEGDAYIRATSGGSRNHVAGASVAGKQSFAPHWWVDPGNGDEYVVYMDYYEKDTQSSGGRATWKQRIDNNQPSGNPVKILDHAFDGGLSRDGTRVAEAYHYLHMARTIDLGGGDGSTISSRLDGGNQCCNSSMSPDNNYHIMHLRIDHEGCNIRDENDGQVQTIWKPGDAEEMQNPEFSTHPDYSTFTAQYGSNYYMYIANTQTGDHLKIAEGNFAVPHLWVATGSPALTLGSSQLNFQAVEGGSNPANQNVAVSNSGQGALDDVFVSEDSNWLSVSRSGAGNDQTLVNTVDITGLSAGNYSVTVEVACANASNSPLSYSVNLDVAEAGDEEAPVITIDTPTNNETVAGSIPVAGSASDNVALDLVEVKADDGSFEAATGTSTWSYTLITTSLTDGEHTLTARATDTSGNTAEDTVTIQVDNQSSQPSITLISPVGGEVWEVGSTQHIRWSTVGIDDVTLRYSTDNGQNWDVLETSVDMSKPEWLDYPWEIPDQPSTECLVYISGYFGEVPTQSPSTFEIREAGEEPDEEIVISGGCSCHQVGEAYSGLGLFLLALFILRSRSAKQ